MHVWCRGRNTRMITSKWFRFIIAEIYNIPRNVITSYRDCIIVLGDTEYLVFDTSDTSQSGIGIDYWPGIARYLYLFFRLNVRFYYFLKLKFLLNKEIQQSAEITKKIVRQVTYKTLASQTLYLVYIN